MSRLRTRSEGLWSGTIEVTQASTMFSPGPLEEVAPGLGFLESFANVTMLDTEQGLVVFDTGSMISAPLVVQALASFRARPVHTIVYTHGHIDHVMGAAAIDEAAAHAGAPRPRVIAHEAVAARFARYCLTAPWNTAINARQFRMPGLSFPTDYRFPDETYVGARSLDIGGARIELQHALGETDDHTYVWLAEQRALITGDLFIWASPNCGNPQKVQRYVREWALALDAMRRLGAKLLLPGHGPPIFGAERVDEALRDTSELLHSLHDQVVALMNAGRRLDEVVTAVRVPPELLRRPYLRPIYDDPQFVIRNIWRRYGGWWDGNPARLLPPPDRALAAKVARLSGGVTALAAAAQAEPDLAIACQLAEWAWQAADPGQRDEVAQLRTALYEERARRETSLMAASIFAGAAAER